VEFVSHVLRAADLVAGDIEGEELAQAGRLDLDQLLRQGQRTKKTREFGCFSSSLGMSISSLVSLNAQVNFNM
jgi:hypothetical protein